MFGLGVDKRPGLAPNSSKGEDKSELDLDVFPKVEKLNDWELV